jgi:predicted ArsR family transcriptional regulator
MGMTDQTAADDLALKQALKAVHGMYIQQQIGLLEALKAELGEKVTDVVRRKASADACAMFRGLAEKVGDTSIDSLVNVLWEPLLTKGYAFTMEKADGGVRMHCTACPFASMYRAMGGAEWGYALYCAADGDLAKAFNPKIAFRREHTLMEGHDCCDHQYFYES